MSTLLDLGTGAPTPLTTSPQEGALFYLSPQAGVLTYICVAVAYGEGLLPPDYKLVLEARTDAPDDAAESAKWATIATTRQGNRGSTSTQQPLPVQTLVSGDGSRAEFLLLPPVRINREWRCAAWATVTPRAGDRITVYSTSAVLMQQQ